MNGRAIRNGELEEIVTGAISPPVLAEVQYHADQAHYRVISASNRIC